VDTYYPHDYDSSIRQLSAVYLRYICSFTVKAFTALSIKFYSGSQQTSVLLNFGNLNRTKQTALLNLTPVSKDSFAIVRLGRQLFAALTHPKDACLNNVLGSQVRMIAN
jgi:hypothetical protein